MRILFSRKLSLSFGMKFPIKNTKRIPRILLTTLFQYTKDFKKLSQLFHPLVYTNPQNCRCYQWRVWLSPLLMEPTYPLRLRGPLEIVQRSFCHPPHSHFFLPFFHILISDLRLSLPEK